MTVAGRTVVITGAAQGIGRALALGFAGDGASVWGGDIDEAGLAELSGVGVQGVRADVSRREDVAALVGAAYAATGRVDVLVNNAGIAIQKRVDEFGPDEFERMLRVHVFGAQYALAAVLPLMRAAGHGRVINMVSRGAEAAAPGWAAYASAKAALFALTRVAAAEHRGTGVLVNGMIPGQTNTAMNRNPSFQPPEATYPSALWLATLPDDGPTGKVFWNRQEYRLFTGQGPVA